MKMTIKHYFDASHQLTDSKLLITKACARLHGHTYAVIVEVTDAPLNDAGMVIDFRAVKDVIDQLDHRHLNDILEMEPTAEHIAHWLCTEIYKKLNLNSQVSICEGYKGQEKASWVTTQSVS